MSWWQLSLNCQASELEQVETLMQELGALSISLSDAGDEPIYEPLPGDNPVWQESILTATFDADSSHETLYQRLTSALPDHLAGTVRQSNLEDQDWDQDPDRGQDRNQDQDRGQDQEQGRDWDQDQDQGLNRNPVIRNPGNP